MPESCSFICIMAVCLFHILESVQILLSGTHLDYPADGIDKDLAVSDVSGIERLFGRLDHGIHGNIADDDFDFDFGQEGCVQFDAAVSLTAPFCMPQPMTCVTVMPVTPISFMAFLSTSYLDSRDMMDTL